MLKILTIRFIKKQSEKTSGEVALRPSLALPFVVYQFAEVDSCNVTDNKSNRRGKVFPSAVKMADHGAGAPHFYFGGFCIGLNKFSQFFVRYIVFFLPSFK